MSDFESFKAKVNDIVLNHPIVVNNEYCAWFAKGEATEEDVRDLTIQFSVFSHYFMQAQLLKVFSAQTLEQYHSGKEILMNELGVAFTKKGTSLPEDEIPTEGTVDGGKYKHASAHFEWLLRFAEPLGLGFNEIGKWHMGTESTHAFCNGLNTWYGNPAPCIGAGASYAVENWANHGFWKQLIAGFEAYNERTGKNLSLGFWKWHDMVEDQHAEHTQEELEEDFEEPWFNEEEYLQGARAILEDVATFWTGLNEARLARQATVTA